MSGQAVSRAYRSELGRGDAPSDAVGSGVEDGVGSAVGLGVATGLAVGAGVSTGEAETSTLAAGVASADGTTAIALADGPGDVGAAAMPRSSPPRANVNTTDAVNAAANSTRAPNIAGVTAGVARTRAGSTGAVATAPRR